MNRRATLKWAKEALRWCGTIGLLLLTPIMLPICFVMYEVDWRGMGRDIRKLHEELWR